MAGVGVAVSSIKGIYWILSKMGFQRHPKDSPYMNGHLQKQLGEIYRRIDDLSEESRKRDESFITRFEVIERRLWNRPGHSRPAIE